MSEWKEETLRDVVVKISDRDHFTPTYVEVGIPMISPKDIKINERIDFSNCKYITEEAHLKNRKKTDLKAGDLVFTRIGALLGKICIVEDWMPEFSILHSAAMIRANESFIIPEYLMYFIKSNYFQSQIRNEIQSIGVPDLGLDKINQFKIYYPTDKIVQQKIAKILTTFDTVIEQTQLAIAKYKAIKQGLLHDLFTRGLDANGKLRPSYHDAPELYKESELGMIPKEWDVKVSSEIVKFINGRAYSIHEWETSGTPVIRLQNLTGSGDTYYYSNLKLPDDQYCNKGDLLYMWSASFGPHIWKGDKAIFHYHIWKVECSNNMLQKYFFYDLLRFTETVLNGANGSTMAHITKEKMDKRLIKTPSIQEQTEIAKRINSLENELHSEENLLQKYQSIKRGLMGDLLGGRKRVKT